MKNKLFISLLSVACASCLTLGLAACSETTNDPNTNSGSTNDQYPTYVRDEEEEGATKLAYVLDEEAGTYTITGMGKETGNVLKIPATIDDVPVTKIADEAFAGKSNITAVTIPDGITEIGKNAFSSCSGIKSITIPGTVVEMGTGVFHSCSGLLNVVFGEGMTSIPNSMFYGCVQLSRVIIPNNITIIGERAFQGCVSLKNVEMGSGVKTISFGAFYNCTGLEEITVGESVETIGNDVFRSCDSLRKVTIPNSVRFIGTSLLQGCSSLEILSVPFIGAFRYDDPPAFLLEGDDNTDSGNTDEDLTDDNDNTDDEEEETHRELGETIDLSEPTTYAFFGYFFGALSNQDTRRYLGPLFNPTYDVDTLGIGKVSVIITGDSNIADGAFNEAFGVKSIVIKGDVTEIMTQGIAFCWNLEELVVPKSLVKLGESVFYSTSNISAIYYAGTPEDWNRIQVASAENGGANNAIFNSAPRYYYSEIRQSGYWHYDKDGLPELWR